MGRVEAFELEGLQCWFCSQDHSPPHFHAKRRGQWEYRVYFLRAQPNMLDLKWGIRMMTASYRKKICGAAAAHRYGLLREWERKVICDD